LKREFNEVTEFADLNPAVPEKIAVAVLGVRPLNDGVGLVESLGNVPSDLKIVARSRRACSASDFRIDHNRFSGPIPISNPPRDTLQNLRTKSSGDGAIHMGNFELNCIQ
jgi:hypothetical protein